MILGGAISTGAKIEAATAGGITLAAVSMVFFGSGFWAVVGGALAGASVGGSLIPHSLGFSLGAWRLLSQIAAGFLISLYLSDPLAGEWPFLSNLPASARYFLVGCFGSPVISSAFLWFSHRKK